MIFKSHFSCSLCLAILFGLNLGTAWGQDDSSSDAAGKSGTATEPAYLLRYVLEPNETLKYQVTHIAKTNTRISGKDELTSVRSLSTKVWTVKEVDPSSGLMSFEHTVADTELSQQIGDADEIRWDSKSKTEPPYQFKSVQETLGKPLATVTINAQGQEKERDAHAGTKSKLGMGGLTIPLPATPIKVGGQWSVPRQTTARLTGGEVKRIDVRELYTLEKVQTGVATIRVQSQPITPIDNAKIKSQIVQQLSNGTIKFDIDAGHVISKQLDWDETVVGFENADSMMEYRARLTETLLEEGTSVAATKIDDLKPNFK